MASDLPAEVDQLGFEPVVRALAGLLNDRNTSLPIAIAVTAPWGAGKSSLMRQLAKELERTDHGSRTWSAVRFDAWKHERSERLWAALATAIYEQAQSRMGGWEKLSFRARLELARRGRWASFLTVLWPLMIAVAVVLGVSRVQLSSPASLPSLLGATALLIGAASRFGSVLANPFKHSIESHATRPDYESQLGFTAAADRDVSVLTRLVARGDRHGLAVFVDDLDRCSSAHLVDVVEAMNQIFNADREHRCVFVLGLDRDIVTTNIEVAYAETVARLEHDGSPLASRFGLEFLGKLVQLSVSLPEPSQRSLEALMGNLNGRAVGSPHTVEPGSSAEWPRSPGSPPATAAGTPAPEDAGSPSAGPRGRGPGRPASSDVADLIEESPEVAAAELASLRWLDANPRQVKRFHNAFRLQLYVASEDDRVRFGFTASELVVLAKWVALRLRWPDLGDILTRSPAMLTRLEAVANDEDHVPSDVKDADFGRWIGHRALHEFLVEDNPARRISALDLAGFLQIS